MVGLRVVSEETLKMKTTKHNTGNRHKTINEHNSLTMSVKVDCSAEVLVNDFKNLTSKYDANNVDSDHMIYIVTLDASPSLYEKMYKSYSSDKLIVKRIVSEKLHCYDSCDEHTLQCVLSEDNDSSYYRCVKTELVEKISRSRSVRNVVEVPLSDFNCDLVYNCEYIKSVIIYEMHNGCVVRFTRMRILERDGKEVNDKEDAITYRITFEYPLGNPKSIDYMDWRNKLAIFK